MSHLINHEQYNQISKKKHWPECLSLTPLQGEASARQYFRLHLADGRHAILMALPEGAASTSEEITNFSGQLERPSFIVMTEDLRQANLPTPEILHYDDTKKWIVLEDLGDQTLWKALQADPSQRSHLYSEAISLLARLHQSMTREQTPNCLAWKRSFDAELLNWEFEHFAEYLLAARGHGLSLEDEVHFKRITQEMTQHIMKFPSSFVHRDYQSKNLMHHNDTLYLIDYQDALEGPYIYDLVSLLCDSYVEFEEEEQECFIKQYATLMSFDETQTVEDFHLMSIQRKMKDAGRFIYIDQVRHNPNFLQYVPNTLGIVQRALQKIDLGRDLFSLLSPYVPEWSTND